MSGQEIILNLWFVIDDEGLIYSLRVRCYVHSGTDEEKLAFLRSFAKTDYIIAQPFPIPERFHTTLVTGAREQKVPMASYGALKNFDGLASLFEEVFQAVENQLPVQTKHRIGQQPIVCMPPLQGDGDGNIRPLTETVEWL